ncbi:MAG: polyphosphate kinase 1, partial [Tissierellia bacterium]|nr:polyphosphate kinase 1 [Tissierellia bacterium]
MENNNLSDGSTKIVKDDNDLIAEKSISEISDLLNYSMNRELSWLNFNRRVLYESMDPLTPEYESIKFVSIFTSNLEEFYRVRVGSLTDLSYVNDANADNKTGMTAKEQLKAIFAKTHELLKEKDEIYEKVMKSLNEHGIYDLSFDELTKKERKEITKYYTDLVEPILSPQIIDFQHPFPFIENNKLHIVLEIGGSEKKKYGLVQVPENLNSYYLLDREGIAFIRLENIIENLISPTFSNYTVEKTQTINLYRNADINTEDYLADYDEDYRSYMKVILKKRNRLQAVALSSNKPISKGLKSFLCDNLSIKENQIFITSSPLIMDYVYPMEDLVRERGLEEILYKSFSPQHNPLLDTKRPYLEQVFERDILFIYPYEDVGEFIQMLDEAAEDPDVISIKITIYRLAKNSRVIRALLRALENGKQVTALMELQARFDEENNINYSDVLIEAGCNIIYGISGYKVHSKVCLITFKKGNEIKHITQIGTGNYNERTSKIYTDLSLVTANDAIGLDAVNFFQNMNIGNIQGHYSSLIVAPISFKQTIIELIDEEISKGEEGRIFFKFNSFTDRDLIIKLSEASRAGVKIRMIVRGISCLRPGVPEYTENIEIRSIVGRYLEHPRIYLFGTGKLLKVYMGSADLMTRNTERRVEVATPIFDTDLKCKILNYMENQWTDNIKSRKMNPFGEYDEFELKESEKSVISQDEMMREAIEEAQMSIATE